MCECAEKMQGEIRNKLDKASQKEIEYKESLNLFKEGIASGTTELVCENLLRIAAYQASIDNGLIRSPNKEQMIHSLNKLMDASNSDIDEEIRQFFYENRNRIVGRLNQLDVPDMLKSVLRNRERALGLLIGFVQREVNQAKALLDRRRKQELYLESWKSGLRLKEKVVLEEIVDIHS